MNKIVCEHSGIEFTTKDNDKYNKLLAFVKECAIGEKYLNDLCNKFMIPNGLDTISMKASDLLIEIGE